MGKKNVQKQKSSSSRSAVRKQMRGGRRHKRNRTQTKFWASVGFTFGKDGEVRRRVGVNSPLFIDEKNPVLAAQQAYESHYKTCDRCRGIKKLKKLDTATGQTVEVYAPCNRGKALHKRMKTLRGVAVAPEQKKAA